MGCFQDKQKSSVANNATIQELSKSIDFVPILTKIRQKYKRYKIQTQQSRYDKSMNVLEYEVRNIFIGVIKQKLMLVNQSKITIKQCKIQIAQQILQVQLMIAKYVQLNYPDHIKNFLTLNDKFLIRVTQFLKTVYPRGQNIQAGQLAKTFKQFDHTEDYEHDILKNAGFCFKSIDIFQITNLIKLFINKIITELDQKFKDFSSIIQGIDPNFKIGRKVSQNTSKYYTLNTGTIQINSMQVARVLIKWMQDLTQTINQCDDKLTAKNQYKFYKPIPNQDHVQFSKCQASTFTKILNTGFITGLKIQRKDFKDKQLDRQNRLKRFRISLLKMLNHCLYDQSQVSKSSMEIIKYSANNNKFIEWMVEQQLIQAIQCLVQISSQYQEYRGILDLVKFKINDLMRCQILGTRTQLIKIFDQFKKLQKQGVLQIVKIKNRFNTPMSDAMLFFKLSNCFMICQCQLVLAQNNKSQDLKATKNIQNINHFLYQLQRSPFGVLGQISVFLSSKSQTVSQYSNKIKLSLTDSEDIDKCFSKHQQKARPQQSKQQRYPFICSKCFIFYPKFSNKFHIYKCNKPTCMINICNSCMKKKFQIKTDLIVNALNKKIQENKNNFKHTLLYKTSPASFQKSFDAATASYLMKYVFLGQKVTQISSIKQKMQGNKVKAQFLIKHILQFPHFQRLYRQSDLKLNFIIITWKGNQVRFKCYRYDHLQNIIINSYQQLQKYENYQMFQVNQFDLFYHVRPQGYYNFNQKTQNNPLFQWKVRQILQKGIYIFQGQSKHKMIKYFDHVEQTNRDQHLLICYPINPNKRQSSIQVFSQRQLASPDDYAPYLIIDIGKSLKRSQGKNKLKNYLQQLSTINQFKKHVQLTNMNLENFQLSTIDTNIQSIENIKSLSLGFNNLSRFEKILSICKKLQKLEINNNRYEQLSFDDPLPFLTELQANENKIEQIKHIGNIDRVQILNLKSNCLHSLSVRSKNLLQKNSLNHLRQLNMSFNKIAQLKQFSKGYDYFPNLSYFDLKQNQIQKVPQLKLQKLQQINLNSNHIYNIQDFVKSNCPFLSKLYLKNNYLQTVPKFNFKNLVAVDFSYNQLDEIKEFSEGQYYQNLIVFFVSLTDPKNLPKLGENIRIFGFQNSNLENQDVENLVKENQFKNLKYLYLTKNNISSIPEIKTLKSLELLCLDQNPIINIDLLLEADKIQKNQNQDNPENKDLNSYNKLQRIWLSLKCDSDEQFVEATKRIQNTFITASENNKKQQSTLPLGITEQIQKIQDQAIKAEINVVASKFVCWRYQSRLDEVSKLVTKSLKSTIFNKFTKKTKLQKTMPKREYLMNFFQSQVVINERYKKRPGTSLYQLQHQWLTIDMDQFVRYDWKDLGYLDLRGAAINNNQWKVFSQNAQLFPNLKQIHIWDNKIQIIPKGSLQKFTSLQLIDFFRQGWQYKLNQDSKKYLRQYKQSNPKKYINF